MKIGAFVPQGWRMDLNGIPVEDQWDTILNTENHIENLNYDTMGIRSFSYSSKTNTRPYIRMLDINVGVITKNFKGKARTNVYM